MKGQNERYVKIKKKKTHKMKNNNNRRLYFHNLFWLHLILSFDTKYYLPFDYGWLVTKF